jgi:hypothetical protein
MLEVILRGLVLSSARRDLRALRLLLMLLERFEPSEAQRSTASELSASDRQILDEFIASLTLPDGER